MKDISSFHALISAKVTWDGVSAETIAKCFRKSGIEEFWHNTPPKDEAEEDDGFAGYWSFVLKRKTLLNQRAKAHDLACGFCG